MVPLSYAKTAVAGSWGGVAQAQFSAVRNIIRYR